MTRRQNELEIRAAVIAAQSARDTSLALGISRKDAWMVYKRVLREHGVSTRQRRLHRDERWVNEAK